MDQANNRGDGTTPTATNTGVAAPSAPVGAVPSIDTTGVRALLTELAAWTGAGGMVKANEFVGRAAAAMSHSVEGEKGGAA